MQTKRSIRKGRTKRGKKHIPAHCDDYKPVNGACPGVKLMENRESMPAPAPYRQSAWPRSSCDGTRLWRRTLAVRAHCSPNHGRVAKIVSTPQSIRPSIITSAAVLDIGESPSLSYQVRCEAIGRCFRERRGIVSARTSGCRKKLSLAALLHRSENEAGLD